MFTEPSSSMSISQPDSSTSFLMFLPPGPMSAPIFSGLIFSVVIRGAYLLMSLRGSEIVFAISARIPKRAMRAFSTVSAMIAWGIPLSLRSNWKPVIPFSVPAILQSMSQYASSQPMMSVSNWYFEIFLSLPYSVQMPTLIPATGRIIGTPASNNASVPPQTDAIEVEPFDSMISLTTRTA